MSIQFWFERQWSRVRRRLKPATSRPRGSESLSVIKIRPPATTRATRSLRVLKLPRGASLGVVAGMVLMGTIAAVVLTTPQGPVASAGGRPQLVPAAPSMNRPGSAHGPADPGLQPQAQGQATTAPVVQDVAVGGSTTSAGVPTSQTPASRQKIRGEGVATGGAPASSNQPGSSSPTTVTVAGVPVTVTIPDVVDQGDPTDEPTTSTPTCHPRGKSGLPPKCK